VSSGTRPAFGGPWIDPIDFVLPRGCGKAGLMMSGPLAEGSSLRRAIAATATAQRKDIDNRDVGPLAAALSQTAPAPVHQRLRNGLILMVEGYDTDPREIYEVPEIRQYWAKLQEKCPTLLFLTARAYPFVLQAVFACISSRLDIVRSGNGDSIHVRIDGETLKRSLAAEMSYHIILDVRLGLKPHKALTRLAESLDALLGKGRKTLT
jgi:hypothetical protein